MVWVDSDIKCPKCNYVFCHHSCSYKSGESYIHCRRCGYAQNREGRFDVEKAKLAYAEAKKLLKDGSLDEAIKVLELDGWRKCGKTSIFEWSDKEKTEFIEHMLREIAESDFKHFFLKDKDGNVVYDDEIKSDCLGTYWYKVKGEVATIVSIRESNGLLGFRKWFENSKEKLEDAGYTEKRGDKWFAVSLKFAKELELKDDDYQVWGTRLVMPYNEYAGEEETKDDD